MKKQVAMNLETSKTMLMVGLAVVAAFVSFFSFALPTFAAYISPSGPVYPGASYSVNEDVSNSGSSAVTVTNDWFYKVNKGGWNSWCHEVNTVPAGSSITVLCKSTGDVAGTVMEFQVNTWRPDYNGTATWSTTGFTVAPRPAPVASASLRASPNPVSYNSGAYLTWDSSNTSSCSLTGFGSVPPSNAGTGYYTGNLMSDKTYTLSCAKTSGATGSPTDSVTIHVNPPPVVTYAISASAGEGGTVSCPNCGSSVRSGTAVTATATANADSGYEFDSWSEGPCSGNSSNVCTFTATSNQSMIANFGLTSILPPPASPPPSVSNIQDDSVQSPGALLARYGTPGTYTWKVPPDVAKVKVKIWGAGGAGASGGYGAGAIGGHGGGGGGYSEYILPVNSGQEYAVVVGAGFKVDENRYTYRQGEFGGSSSFGSFTATGGRGGVFSVHSPSFPGTGGLGNVANGGSGGFASLSSVGANSGGAGGGGAGGQNGENGGAEGVAGLGGAGRHGGGSGGAGGSKGECRIGRQVGPGFVTEQGAAGSFPGGGGGGGNNFRPCSVYPHGGSGANGQVIIEILERTAVRELKPDLVASPLTVEPKPNRPRRPNEPVGEHYFYRGTKVTISGMIKNQGAGAINKPFSNSIRDAQTNLDITADAPKQMRGGLATGAVAPYTYTFPDIGVGTKAIQLCADSGGDIDESDEENCSNAVTIRVLRRLAPKPELFISANPADCLTKRAVQVQILPGKKIYLCWRVFEDDLGPK